MALATNGKPAQFRCVSVRQRGGQVHIPNVQPAGVSFWSSSVARPRVLGYRVLEVRDTEQDSKFSGDFNILVLTDRGCFGSWKIARQ
jgi:hypothetical protein